MERTSQNTIIAAVGKDLKRAFSDECSKRGRSMTSVVRKFAEDYVNNTRSKQHKIKDRISVAKEDFGTSASSSKANPVGSARSHQIY